MQQICGFRNDEEKAEKSEDWQDKNFRQRRLSKQTGGAAFLDKAEQNLQEEEPR